MTAPSIAILGAGPAGVGAAYRLARRGGIEVTVIEQRDAVGGNAGSFELAGMQVDYGSHRLHGTETPPEILADLRALLGSDLRERPRDGRLRLRGRWVRFPPRPLDLLTHLPPGFAAGAAWDACRRVFERGGDARTYADALRQGLGRTICRDFYFPYARKLWGLEPDRLSAVQARRRVGADTPAKLLRKVAAAIPGLGGKGANRFYYPAGGYGQMWEAMHRAARDAGAHFALGARVSGVDVADGRVAAVRYGDARGAHTLTADTVWSTLPVTALAGMIQPAPPASVTEAARHIRFQGMILVYLVLQADRFTAFDAHYIPDADNPISRLSEPKNYAGRDEPRGRTVLCAEIPTSPDSDLWDRSDAALGSLATASMARAGLAIEAPIASVAVRRLRHAYPIYEVGFEAHFETIDRWLDGIGGLLSFGRQGLFVHDNSHHALAMAYAAVACLEPSGAFDRERWRGYRRAFERHVVAD